MEHPTHVGKYELEQFLGGGMSHVYRAKDSVLGRRVALKILTEAGMQDSEAKARFLQEARMASNIRHENIISIYDFGEDQGRPFMVMEFLEGESLRDAITNHHTGDVEQQIRIAIQIGRALDYIHSRKIVHRDVKPENIHLDAAKRVKLMDFGIAKSDNVQLTRVGFTLGTPYYMAPEQVLGKPLNPQADVYAFGVLLFELLTGEKAVTANSVEEIFQAILYDPLNLEPLRKQHIPEGVIEVVRRCTAKKLIERPRTLSEVCDELEMDVGPVSRPSTSQPAPPPGLLSPTATRDSAEAVRLPMPPRPPRRLEEEDKPGFLDRLPASLRSETALMLLAAATMLVLALIVFAILVVSGVV